jgi:hypothetical protein
LVLTAIHVTLPPRWNHICISLIFCMIEADGCERRGHSCTSSSLMNGNLWRSNLFSERPNDVAGIMHFFILHTCDLRSCIPSLWCGARACERCISNSWTQLFFCMHIRSLRNKLYGFVCFQSIFLNCAYLFEDYNINNVVYSCDFLTKKELHQKFFIS